MAFSSLTTKRKKLSTAAAAATTTPTSTTTSGTTTTAALVSSPLANSRPKLNKAMSSRVTSSFASSSSTSSSSASLSSSSITASSDDEDEEFRRAQEIALAVAALGGVAAATSQLPYINTNNNHSSKSKRSRLRFRKKSKQPKPLTAEDIRMAVADAICIDRNGGSAGHYRSASDTPKSGSSTSRKRLVAASRELQQAQERDRLERREQKRQQRKEEKIRKKQQKEQQRQLRQEAINQHQQQILELRQKREQQSVNFVRYLITSVWNDTAGPYVNPWLCRLLDPCARFFHGKVLQGVNLVIFLVVMNGCVFYLANAQSAAASSPSSKSMLVPICNVVFIVNMTLFLCLADDESALLIPPPPPPLEEDGEAQERDMKLNDTIDEPAEPEGTSCERRLMPAPTSQSSASSLSSSGTNSQTPSDIPAPEQSVRLEWLDDVTFQDTDLRQLEQLQPESTLAERRRFLKARKHCVKAASAQLGTYLQWRRENRLQEFFPSTFFSTDQEDWAAASRGALEISNTTGKPIPTHLKLPRLVSIFEDEQLIFCKNGARVVHVLPCQLDANLAPASTYALAVAMYLDRKLHRQTTEKVTVVIDIRFGNGWTNPSSVSIVPFIKLVVGLLNTYFPERLSRCILFPLPRTATMLFNTAKSYLDPDTAAKIQVCSGAGSVTSKVPDKVYQFIDPSAIAIMEERRYSFFKS